MLHVPFALIGLESYKADDVVRFVYMHSHIAVDGRHVEKLLFFLTICYCSWPNGLKH